MVILMNNPNTPEDGPFSGRTVFNGTVDGNREYIPRNQRTEANSKTVRAKFPHIRYNDAINKYFNGETPSIVEELKETPIFLALTYTDNKGTKQTMCSTFGDSEYPIGIDPKTEQLYIERPDKEATIIDGDPNTLKFIDLHANNLHCNEILSDAVNNQNTYEELWTDLIN